MITPGSSAFDNSSVDWSTLASVADFSLLPDVLEYAGVSYLVLNATGTWLLGIKKKAGLYRSTGSEWLYMGSNVVIDDSSPSTEKAFSSQKISDQLLLKVSKEVGKALSANDYTDTEKAKLLGIEDSAQANTVDSVAGKTGAVTLTKGDVALPNVDNVSDVNKPISTAQQNALDSKIDDNQVLTNVPLGAVFTDTVYSKPTSEPIGYIANLQAALNLKANQATTYTKTEVDDKDALKAPLASPTFTGTVEGVFAGNGSGLTGLLSSQMPVGSVVQMQSIELPTALSLASSTWTDVGGSITFTPKFANSKLVIMFTSQVYIPAKGADVWEAANYRILRDAVVVANADLVTDYGFGGIFTSTKDRFMGMYSKDYIDAPASTAAIVYKPQTMSLNATSVVHNQYGSGSFTIMEIKQ